MENIRWSSKELTMRRFVEDYCYFLPVVFLTTSGYSGCDEHIHQISASEIYYVKEIQRQKRIVAWQKKPNGSRCYVSIPITHQIKVQIITKGKRGIQDQANETVGPPVSMSDLMRRVEEDDSLTFQFEDNQTVSFQIGADQGTMSQFGMLKVENSYDEKYLIAYPIHSGKMFSKTIGIPVYLDITVTVAEEMVNGGREGFDKWMQDVKQIVNRLQSSPVNKCQEIILFDRLPSDVMYEYMKPTTLATIRSLDMGRLLTIETKQHGHTSDQEMQQSLMEAMKKNDAAVRNRPPLPIPDKSAVDSKTGMKMLTTRMEAGHPSSSAAASEAASEAQKDAQDMTQAKSSGSGNELLTRPSLASYQTPEEIPADLNIRELCVEDVSRILTLLKMENRCNTFESEQVDGARLVQLDENILVRDFGFSNFDAKKLMMFTKGWRPKNKLSCSPAV